MGEIFLTRQENELVERILRTGLGLRKGYKWQALRFALARSLQIVDPPAERDEAIPPQNDRGAELHMEQITGEGRGNDDYTDIYRLLLSTYHDNDLFADRGQFVRRLQGHVRRGLAEIGRSWREGNDFHDYLYQEFYADVAPVTGTVDDRERILALLGRLGVRAAVQEVQHGPRLTRYVLGLDSADDRDRLKSEYDKIPFELGYGEGLSFVTLSGEQRKVALDLPRAERDWWLVTWESVAGAVRNGRGTLPLCPGTDVLGQPYVFDLAEAPHLFVAGATGSGKSQCVHALILSLLTAGRTVQLALIDPKQVEFTRYSRLGERLWRGHQVAVEPKAAVALLEALVVEMEARQAVLVGLEAADLAEAQVRGSPLPRIVVIIDELADLLLTAGDAISDPLSRLAHKARAVGIHLILATQRPDAETFPGILRSNIPSRIALTVQKAAESRIILDEGGAEKLLMRGDMLIKIAGRRLVRAHGARVTPGDIAAVTR